MSNDDWQIVPQRDEAISSRARPAKNSDSRKAKASSGAETSHNKKPQKKSGGSGFLFFLLLVSFAGSGYLYYLLQESNTLQSHLEARVASMEGKLSVTDESLSQSGAAMQAVLQDHDVQLETQMSEIRKLWGVAYDTNRKSIDELRANTATLATNLSDTRDQVATFEGVPERLNVLSSQTLIHAADLEDTLTRLRETRDELNQHSGRFTQLEAQSAEHLEAIESIDAFRVQMNQRFIQLEDEVRSLSASSNF